MVKHLANAISILFHPIVMPTIGIFIIFSDSFYLSLMPEDGQFATYLIVFTSTFALPLIMIPVFMLRKVIKSFEMTQRQERIIPLFVTSIFYFFAFFTLIRLKAPVFISSFILGAFITVLLVTLINIKWKISIHMAGIGGLVGMITALVILFKEDSLLFFSQSLLIAGLVGSARLYLNAHNLKQVSSGFLLGLATVLFTIFIYNI